MAFRHLVTLKGSYFEFILCDFSMNFGTLSGVCIDLFVQMDFCIGGLTMLTVITNCNF